MEECCCCQGHCGRVLLLSGSLWKSVVAIRIMWKSVVAISIAVEEWCCPQGHRGSVCHRVTVEACGWNQGHQRPWRRPWHEDSLSNYLLPLRGKSLLKSHSPCYLIGWWGVIPLFLWTKYLFDFPSTHSCVIHFSSFP